MLEINLTTMIYVQTSTLFIKYCDSEWDMKFIASIK